MIVEIFREDDISKVPDKRVQEYIYGRFKILDEHFDPSREGYFIYVDDVATFEIKQTLSFTEIPSIKEGLFKRLEQVEITNSIIEISFLVNNDFMLSIVTPSSEKVLKLCRDIIGESDG